jgi:membrane-bound lytic murein transglycosylase B
MNLFRLMVVASFLLVVNEVSADYSQNTLAQQFIQEMVQEEGFEATELNRLFAQVEKKDSIIDAMNRPAEKVLTWGEYRKIFLGQNRINGGVDFWNKNQQVLTEAQEQYGVPAEVIVAIIGVETLYGRITGSYRVIDALSTLAFDYPARAPFFRSELKEFLILSREQGQSPLLLLGSYAGAMGLGQFMPSSYRAYAADYGNDGFIDIWNNEADAIWSVASYLSHHGWQAGESIAHRASISREPDLAVINQGLRPEHQLQELVQAGLQPEIDLSPDRMATAMQLESESGDEYWVGMHNFYVITRYNRSHLYAMAVFQLSEEIRQQKR